jgi:N-acylneuraminate cytidylyltransferase/CMP-N,N'-diacetyllegionaminic acid synthase
MQNGKKILGIIPARAGSKGLPGKNIKMLVDKPLIAWTAEQALSSNYIDNIVVSTDSRDIAEVAKNYGCEVPFLRPSELATDKSNMMDVVLHAIDRLEKDDSFFDAVMLLQPTAPLRTAQDIDNAIRLFSEKEAEAVVSVCEVEHHPYWSNTLPLDGCMKDFLIPEARKNRQELPTFYRLNGSIYLARTDYFKLNRTFIGDNAYAYIMPPERSVDIDTELDFKLAELLIRQVGSK